MSRERGVGGSPADLDCLRTWTWIVCLLFVMIQFVLLFSRQGKLRLQKWFDAYQVNYLL